MAVPTNPTVTTIVTQALKRAGRTVPTAAQILEASEHALQEVKADIMLLAPTHRHLLMTSTTVTTTGQQRYTVPDDWNEQESIQILTGPEDWTGTIQGAGSSSITLPLSFTMPSEEIVGKYLIITNGLGVEEYRQLLTYNAGTRVATIDLPWVEVPNAASTCRIIQQHLQLWPNDVKTDFDVMTQPTMLGVPRIAAISGQEFLLYPTPDRSTYGLINRYFCDLSKLDEGGPLFIQLLREWRSIWVQGVAVKSMQRFDEDRYQSELQVYKAMLDFLTSQTCLVKQVTFNDL